MGIEKALKRCKHCAYLLQDKTGLCVCDIDGTPIKFIGFCEAVEK